MRILLLPVVLLLAACGALPPAADSDSEAPHERFAAGSYPAAASHPQALARWSGAEAMQPSLIGLDDTLGDDVDRDQGPGPAAAFPRAEWTGSPRT